MICKTLKDDITNWLKKREFFSNVDVIGQDKGDVLTAVQEAIAKMGLCVVVEVTGGDVKYPDVGVGAIAAKVAFIISENVLINRADGGTGKTADDATDEILVAFNPMNGVALPCLCTAWRLVNDTDGLLAYQVDATAQVNWKQKGST